MPWHTRYLHYALPQANVFATWLSGNIALKSSDLLSQERNECFAMTTSSAPAHIISAFFAASFSIRERMDVCLELLLGRFSVCPAAYAVFSVVGGLEDAADVSDLQHVCPGLFFHDLHLKMILSRLCTFAIKFQYLFAARVYTDLQLTMYLGKMFYTLFLISESNQPNTMAIAH